MSPHLCLCSAFQPRLQRASQMLHFYSSVSQKRPQSAAVSHYTRLSGSAPVSFPCHLPFASENQQGNASNHLSCKHTASCILPLFVQGKTFASVSLSKTPDKLHVSLHGEHLCCKVFIKMTSFCLCLLFVPLSTPVPRLSFCSSPVSALKKFRGTLLSEMCKLLGFFSISRV